MRRPRVVGIGFVILAMLCALLPGAPAQAQEDGPPDSFEPQDDAAKSGVGAAPFDLAEAALPVSASPVAPFYSANGNVTLSVDGVGTSSSTGSVTIDKPAGATLRKAFLMAASTGFTGYEIQDGDVLIGGATARWLPARTMTNSISSVNVMADVTDNLRTAIDNAAGPTVSFTITEATSSRIDGVILAVVYDDPNVTVPKSVVLAYGAQQVTGDAIQLLRSNTVAAGDVEVTLGVGITFGCQPDDSRCAGVQDNTVSVNGTLITSSAGGQDDGVASNGALITVGGRGDSPTNPSDPTASGNQSSCPRCDDELYDLSAFVGSDENAELVLTTQNPSADDNFMFAAIEVTGATADWEESDPAPEPPAGFMDPVITAPSNGDTIDQGPFTVRGYVPGGGNETISAVFAMQLTDSSSGSDCNGDGSVDQLDDFNVDTVNGSSIDCQIAALIALNNQLASVPNSESSVQVGFVPFGSIAVPADMSGEPGFQTFTSPQADTTQDLDRLNDVSQVAASSVQGLVRQFEEISVGTGDNLAAAIEAATYAIDDLPGKRVIYVLANDVSSISASTLQFAQDAGVTIFPIGTGTADCAGGSALNDIAEFFDTPCVSAADPGQLVQAALTPPPWLDSVIVSIDGRPAQLAQVDPLGNFSVQLFGAVGTHTVTATARYTTPGEQRSASVTFTSELQTTYVHMGDSWASGDGIENFLPYPNEDNGCFQSEFGQGNIIFEDPFLGPDLQMGNLDRTIVACSGALIPNILSVAQDKRGIAPPQIDALDQGVDIATIQVGGNDVGFGNIVWRCITHFGALRNCFDDGFVSLVDGTELTVRDYVSARMAIVAPELRSMYIELDDRIGSDSPLVVIGYPALLEQDAGFLGNNCFSTSKDINGDERREIRSFARQFNGVVANAADDAGVHFVDVFELFEGHNACSGSDEWVRGETLSRGGETPSFHPNKRGQAVLAYATCGYLQSLAAMGWPRNGIGLPLNPGAAGLDRVTNPDLGSCGFVEGATVTTVAPTQDLAATAALLPPPGLTDEQLAEIGTYEFGSARISTLGEAVGQISACDSAVVPNQHLIVSAQGFDPGEGTVIEVTDSITNTTRQSPPKAAGDDGSVSYSVLVPHDDLTGSLDTAALITIEIIGRGATRGGPRITTEGVIVDLDPDSQCAADLVDSGEVSLDGGPAPRADAIDSPEIADIGEVRAAMDDEVVIVAPFSALVDVLANDADDLTTALSVTTQPSQGTATVVDRKVLYEPGVSTETTDSFTYEICTEGICSTATVTITINPPRCRRRGLTLMTATIWGTNGADVITGTAGDDVIVTFAGNDTIDAGDGDNTICAGAGADDITSGSGRDFIRGGSGDDTIHAGLGIDRIFADSGNDEIFGEGGSDRIWGGYGNDIIWAGSGADRVWGGFGDDVLNGMGGQDFLWAEDGNDTMQGNHQSDRMWGGAGDDTIRGAEGKDKLYGESGDDMLFGGANTDYLDGGEGDDIANGQRGKDNPLVPDVSGCVAEVRISC